MQRFKNISVGFAVSFLGSIPLGYLNIVGFEIFKEFGFIKTCFFLLGVVTIEFLVVYFTLIFANKLLTKKKLLYFIKGFSVVFMFVLAYMFFTNGDKSQQNKAIFASISNNFYSAGIVLSCFNFIQIPFWLSWNLNLLNQNYIRVDKGNKFFYILGTILGTFIGMLVLIVTLKHISTQTDFLTKYLLKFIIPFVFVGLGVFQGYKFYNETRK